MSSESVFRNASKLGDLLPFRSASPAPSVIRSKDAISRPVGADASTRDQPIHIGIPLNNLNWPKLPASDPRDAKASSDEDSDEPLTPEDEANEADLWSKPTRQPKKSKAALPTQSSIQARPEWLTTSRVTCMAACIVEGHTVVFTGSEDGSIRLFRSLPTPSADLPPQSSPEILTLPSGPLLSTLLFTKQRRLVSRSATPSRTSRTSSPPESVASLRSTRSTRAGDTSPRLKSHRPRKASATVSISGFDAFSAPTSSNENKVEEAASPKQRRSSDLETLSSNLMPGLHTQQDRRASAQISRSLLSEEWSSHHSNEEVLQVDYVEEDAILSTDTAHPDQSLHMICEIMPPHRSAVVDITLIETFDQSNPATNRALSPYAIITHRNGTITKRDCNDGESLASMNLEEAAGLTGAVQVDNCHSLNKDTLCLCSANAPFLLHVSTFAVSASTLNMSCRAMASLSTADGTSVALTQDNTFELLQFSSAATDSPSQLSRKKQLVPSSGLLEGSSPRLLAMKHDTIILWTTAGFQIWNTTEEAMDLIYHNKSKDQILDIFRISSSKFAVVLQKTESDSITLYTISNKDVIVCSAEEQYELDAAYDKAYVLKSPSSSSSGFFASTTIGTRHKISWNSLQRHETTSLMQWQQTGTRSSDAEVTAAMMLADGRLAVAYASGHLAILHATSLLSQETPAQATALSEPLSLAVGASIVYISRLSTIKKLAVGTSDGAVAILDENNLAIEHFAHLFACPVSQITSMDRAAEEWHESILIQAVDGSVAIYKSPEQPILQLPPSRARLRTVNFTSDQILLLYASDNARLYHCSEGLWEMRRSMTLATAQELLLDGNWLCVPAVSSSAPVLACDFRAIIHESALINNWTETERNHTDALKENVYSQEHLAMIRLLLGRLLSPGLSHSIDEIASTFLHIPYTTARLFANCNSQKEWHTSTTADESQCWTISRIESARRLFLLLALSRSFLNFANIEREASELITYYASFLPARIGPAFVHPDLGYLAGFWFDSTRDIQEAAQLALGVTVSNFDDSALADEANYWHMILQQRYDVKTGHWQALLVLGLIAVDRVSALTPGMLKAIADMIYEGLLQDSDQNLQMAAVELCSRGFATWQHYIEPVMLVQTLFALSTGEQAQTRPEIRTLSSKAILQVAAVNTQLFMATLAFDVLHTKSVSHRIATMRLVGFMIRKKPLVMLPTLPKLAEAVVKSLDPSNSALRSTVQQTATIMLGELVKTYPTIDFHRGTQRLVVGTNEGACIMYDLKTATRLYVLESHTKAVTACSFSPDGRRLVSVSVEESCFSAWKVGSSLLGLLTPGQAPRQGSTNNKPYKSIDFTLAGDTGLSPASILSWVNIEWPTSRSVKLMIKEAAFSFSIE